MAHPLQKLGLGDVGGLGPVGGLLERGLIGVLLPGFFLLIVLQRAVAHQLDHQHDEQISHRGKHQVFDGRGVDRALWQVA